MQPAAEYIDLGPPGPGGDWALACWDAYDPKNKVQLHAHALRAAGRLVFVDPIPLNIDPLDDLLSRAGASPDGIVLTNANHARAADQFRRRFHIPICAMTDAAQITDPDADPTLDPAVGPPHTVDLPIPATGGPIFEGMLEAIPLPGSAPGEIALYRPDGGGLVIVGDALINMGSHGFSVLPDKYCENPKTLRQSLAKLAQRRFATMVFAHGEPIVSAADEKLRALLG